MFGLGTRKPPSLDRFPMDSWSVATGESDGRPLIVRVNAGCKKYIAHPELPCRLGVTVTFRAPDERGFPSKAEQEHLSTLEDALTEKLHAAKVGYPALVITTGGKRELVFYIRDRIAAETIVEIACKLSDCQTCYGFEDDPAWAYYSQFA